jgi:two-component system, sensor histidine kinase
MLAVSVEDTGIGMSQDTLAHLFEPFSQGDTSNTRRHGGTGLGLNITRAICRHMGGDVACRSELKIGSVFTVTLPLERLRDQERPTFRSTRPDTLLPSESVGGYVLLAEDNEVNALVAEFALKRFGVQVETVGNGIDVVVRMCSTGPRPDLVLLDCQMPGMDGFEAARRVRAFEAEHGLDRAPIVALTANVFQDDRERCREAGMDAFLGKPFTDQQLRDVLMMYLVLPSDDSAPGDPVDSSYATRLL